MSEQSEIMDELLEYIRKNFKEAQKAGDSDKAAQLKALGSNCQALAAHMAELEQRLKVLPKEMGDLSDLPDELLDELQTAKVDELEQQVVDVLRALQGPANLDQILIGLFRKFSVMQKRRYLMNRLYKMAQRELIVSVPRKKAVYVLPEFYTPEESADDVDELNESEDDDLSDVLGEANEDFPF